MDLNKTIEQIIALHDTGGNPQQIMQLMFGNNPNLNQMAMQYKNMTQGRNPKDAILQLAKQGGISEQNLKGLARILGVK